jgi:hypothetical protein
VVVGPSDHQRPVVGIVILDLDDLERDIRGGRGCLDRSDLDRGIGPNERVRRS